MYSNFKIHNYESPHKDFVPYFKQKLWLDCVDNGQNIIARRTRQCGYTTLHVMSALKLALTNDNFKIGLCELSNRVAIDTLNRVEWVYKNSNMDDISNVHITYRSQHQIIFCNGSAITITSHDTYRRQKFDMLYLDIRKKDDIYTFTRMIPFIPRWSVGYHYIYKHNSSELQSLKEYRKTISDLVKSGAQLIDFNWYDYPGRNDEWRVTNLPWLDDRAFKQEFELPDLHS